MDSSWGIVIIIIAIIIAITFLVWTHLRRGSLIVRGIVSLAIIAASYPSLKFGVNVSGALEVEARVTGLDLALLAFIGFVIVVLAALEGLRWRKGDSYLVRLFNALIEEHYVKGREINEIAAESQIPSEDLVNGVFVLSRFEQRITNTNNNP